MCFKIMFGYAPLPSEHLASEHSASKGIIDYDPPASGETYDILNS